MSDYSMKKYCSRCGKVTIWKLFLAKLGATALGCSRCHPELQKKEQHKKPREE